MVWRGAPATLTLGEIADLIAPILWFSPDEPLLARGLGPLPYSHPCDSDRRRGVVYYQVTRIQLRGEAAVREPVDDDPELFAKARAAIIRFYFYYPEDIGVAGHVNDLEVVEFQLQLDDEGGCRQVRIERVIGFAHGVDWYYNRLVVTPDTKLPIAILVEEGKHASCPDRNADGFYLRFGVPERSASGAAGGEAVAGGRAVVCGGR